MKYRTRAKVTVVVPYGSTTALKMKTNLGRYRLALSAEGTDVHSPPERRCWAYIQMSLPIGNGYWKLYKRSVSFLIVVLRIVRNV